MKILSSSYKTLSAIPVLRERFQTQKVTRAKQDSYLHFKNQPSTSNPEVSLSLGVTAAIAWMLFILFMISKVASPPLLTVTFYCLSTPRFQRWPSWLLVLGDSLGRPGATGAQKRVTARVYSGYLPCSPASKTQLMLLPVLMSAFPTAWSKGMSLLWVLPLAAQLVTSGRETERALRSNKI